MLTARARCFILTWDKVMATYNTDGALAYANYRRGTRLVKVATNHVHTLAYLRQQGLLQMKPGSPLRRLTVEKINRCRRDEGLPPIQ